MTKEASIYKPVLKVTLNSGRTLFVAIPKGTKTEKAMYEFTKQLNEKNFVEIDRVGVNRFSIDTFEVVNENLEYLKLPQKYRDMVEERIAAAKVSLNLKNLTKGKIDAITEGVIRKYHEEKSKEQV